MSLPALRVPAAFFTTMVFPVRTFVAFGAAILSARKPASVEVAAAVVCGPARVTGIDRRMVVVSSDCAYRLLVALHIRFDGNRFDRVSV
ncbi:hypothetical protein [Burkholderia cepacia]|uniref:hypothetical protein n=1 Tax=Burkholderia cepacia TaxID=292 RepID=UPI001650E8ED|nr:hypothetical protein [Burkholderia cepacia]